MMRMWQTWVVLAALLALLVLLGWMHSAVPSAPVNVSVSATPAPAVRALPKVAVTLAAPVQVYAGGALLKRKLKLPDRVIANADQQVLAASQVQADEHPQTITTVINSQTGVAETFVKRDPLPWLAWDHHGDAGIYAGFKNGSPALRLEARQGLVQVKALHFGVSASIDQPLGGAGRMDSFIGVGVWTKW
jgi:hypothetical protein